jgi:myo-inositol catabolism protein IolH
MFSRVPFEKAIEEVSRIGYEYVEFLLGPHLNVDATDDQVEAAGHVLKQYGVKVAAVLGGGPLASLDSQKRCQAVEGFKRQIAIARLLECDLVTGEMSGGTSRERDACIEAFTTSLQGLVPILEREGVRASFEPHPGDFLEDSHSAVDVLKGIGSEKIGYLYCCPHTFILGEDPGVMIEYAAGLLNHVHIADTYKQEKIVVGYAPMGYANMLRVSEYEGVMNAHLHLVPGRGEVDFDQIFRTLKRVGYEGAVSAIPFETERPGEAAAESLTMIRQYRAEAQ